MHFSLPRGYCEVFEGGIYYFFAFESKSHSIPSTTSVTGVYLFKLKRIPIPVFSVFLFGSLQGQECGVAIQMWRLHLEACLTSALTLLALHLQTGN